MTPKPQGEGDRLADGVAATLRTGMEWDEERTSPGDVGGNPGGLPAQAGQRGRLPALRRSDCPAPPAT